MRGKLAPATVEALIVLGFLCLAVGAGAIGWVVGAAVESNKTVTVTQSAATQPATTQPATTETSAQVSVSPSVAAGAHDFIEFGCFACHGELGVGGVSPDVPALTGVAKAFTVDRLTSIIEHGLGESANPTRPYMPVWRGVISTRQISELVDYLRAGLPAVPGAVPATVPTGQGDAVAGAALYQFYGCGNCHGPNGLGGVPNPASPDKTIPPLSGTDFRTEFNTDQKIIDFIRSGSVLGKAPIVSMPHWGGIIPDPNLQALVAYLKTLAP